ILAAAAFHAALHLGHFCPCGAGIFACEPDFHPAQAPNAPKPPFQAAPDGWLLSKGFTSYRANELFGGHGQACWQVESYDHLVRSECEFDRIRSYIEENPVSAGL